MVTFKQPRKRARSRKLRKIYVKLPGNKVTLHYRKRKPSHVKCANCKKPLKGTLRELPSVMKNLPKTYKKPSRPYGGYLCSNCTRELIKAKFRR
ncbi:MAG: 50S ribosomal protein L34e [Candidatus Nanoarchaeia archaeon]|nr:50S ribosomal protein L34e [Candidatus Nanoarchaeia archaeon]MDD5587712.1 50S ribosomal protein L34e [Candidatus Nanoarchaeia archaeon]